MSSPVILVLRALAYRTPSVALYGPVPAEQWGPPPGGPHLALGSTTGL